MKNKQRLLTALSAGFLLLTGIASASEPPPCSASFLAVQTSPNTIAFNSTSSGVTANTTFTWSFGDGNFATGPITSHVYFNPGTYVVCLRISDGFHHGCHSIHCDSVHVTGTVICHLDVDAASIPASCATCTNGVGAVVDIDGGTPPFRYSWSNGDTTRVAHGLAPGVYVVCVTDANHCRSCDTVIVHARRHHHHHCEASFHLVRDTTHSVTYFALSTSLGIHPFHYVWSWGDASPNDTTAHPMHTYAHAGPYTICLTITDATGCTSTFCRHIHTRAPSSDPFGAVTILVGEDKKDTEIDEAEPLSWSLYPNPSSDRATISYTLTKNTGVTVMIYDLSGREVMTLKNVSEEQAGEYNLTVNTNTLQSGSYFIRIRTNDQVSTKHLNIAR